MRPPEGWGGPRPSPRSRDESGAVLVFVVLAMLALIALGHGVLASSLGELAASRAVVGHLLGRAAAEGAIQLGFAQSGGAWTDSVSIGGSRSMGDLPLGRARASWTLRRLAPEAWLVEGEGALPGHPPARAARLAWALDPLVRITALDAVVTVAPGAPVTLLGAVEVAAPSEVVPPLSVADCARWLPELEAREERAPLAAVATLADTARAPRLGLLDFAALLAAGDVRASGVGTPAPVERWGVCALDEPWGWGDPEQPWTPCGGHLPMRAAAGDLRVVGGAGQGLLVVDGDLSLTSSAKYHGLVLVRGVLRLEDAASLEGLAVALGGLHVGADARVRGSPCWAVRAVSAQRARLGGLVPFPGAAVVGPLP